MYSRSAIQPGRCSKRGTGKKKRCGDTRELRVTIHLCGVFNKSYSPYLEQSPTLQHKTNLEIHVVARCTKVRYILSVDCQYVILRCLSLPSIEGDAGGSGDGREPIGDVHHPVIFGAPSLLRDVARRVDESRHLETQQQEHERTISASLIPSPEPKTNTI